MRIYIDNDVPRDGNHTVFYLYLRARRRIMQNIGADSADLFNYTAQATNALARLILGCAELMLEMVLEATRILRQKFK